MPCLNYLHAGYPHPQLNGIDATMQMGTAGVSGFELYCHHISGPLPVSPFASVSSQRFDAEKEAFFRSDVVEHHVD